MLNYKTIKELYKESAHIDNLYGVLWGALKKHFSNNDFIKHVLSKLNRMKKQEIIKMIIESCRQNDILDEFSVDENDLLDFLLDTPKKTLLEFIGDKNLAHLHSNQEILIIVLDAISELKPDPDQLLDETGDYFNLRLIIDVMVISWQKEFFTIAGVSDKVVLRWFNDMPAEGMAFLRIMAWRSMNALDKIADQ